ncbi:MAG: hypothetical protein FJX72_12675, partial [Armatimonadetes bacterium]|nr:hypothetical protein [Armatimonadota bacterium]
MSARSLPYDSLTLHAIVHELKCLIVGAQVQQIRQPSNDEIELALRAPGRTHHLRISCDPRAARMHLASGRTPTPGAAGTFAMSLRKHVEGGIVQSVAQVGFDRIAVIEIANQARLLRLMVEIMGRHSNILLLDQHDVILDCCRHAGPSVNRLRVLLPGRPYLAPPVASGELDPLADACEAAVDAMAGLRGLELEEALRGAFVGMSPFLASELSARTELRGIASAWDETVGRAVRCEWAPVVVRDVEGRPLGAYPFPLTHTYGWVQEGAPTANAAIAE